ncbi:MULTISPECIES: YagK/YfjJ domain-containing protein [unclassified Maridesulfovibrio]|uniref:YagK/YfjJ domain-containing protein n=1 Tax=unclassified Maridesulfovibrio TaxID=2794999 RepID=UPI003B3DCB4A
MSNRKDNENGITYEKMYNGKKILTDKDKGYGCYKDILQKTDRLMTTYTGKHNKANVTRFDLKYPKDENVPTDNKDFSRFASTFNKALKRKGLDPKYIAVREQSREKHQHYHVAVLTDGNKIRSPHTVIKTAEEHWNRTLGKDKSHKSLVHYCTKSRSGEKQTNHYVLRRNDDNFEKEMNDCFERCSYLAKTNTKGNTPHRTREVFSSRITN